MHSCSSPRQQKWRRVVSITGRQMTVVLVCCCQHQGSARQLYIRSGRSFQMDRRVGEVKMFYIGREGTTLTNLLVSYSQSQVRR